MATELRMPRTQREQLMVFLAILGLGGAGYYWYGLYNPKNLELDALQARADTLDQRNQEAKAELAKGTVDELRQQAEIYRENLALMRQLVPASHEVPSLLDQVSTAARQAGLDIGQVDVLGVDPGLDFDAHRYRLSINGPYHAITEFLTNVGSLRRIVTPVNIVMRASGATTPTRGASVLPRTVSATFELHTYVARTAPSGGGE